MDILDSEILKDPIYCMYLWYDDDGNKLEIGDNVLVNDGFETFIAIDEDGDRYLAEWPSGEVVHSLERKDTQP